MNNATILLVVLAAVLAVFGGLAVVIPRLVKKGIDLSGDRAVITYGGVVVAAVKLADLTLI